MPAAFAVTSLHKRFRTRFGRTESVALDGVDLELPRGEAFGLIGPNAAGALASSAPLAPGGLVRLLSGTLAFAGALLAVARWRFDRRDF